MLEPTVTHDLSDDPQFTRTLSRANPERRYIGYPMEVESWFEDAWSTCIPPTEQEIADVKNWHEDVQKKIANARFDAVCWLDVDGKKIPRGVIFSVPRL